MFQIWANHEKEAGQKKNSNIFENLKNINLWAEINSRVFYVVMFTKDKSFFVQ